VDLLDRGGRRNKATGMLAEETEVNVTNFTWSHRLVRFHEQVGLACYSHTTSGRNNGGRDQRELECRSGEGILITIRYFHVARV